MRGRHRSYRRSDAAGLLKTGFSGKAGVLITSLVAEPGSGAPLQRLQTTFRSDDVAHMRTFVVGDAATLDTGFSPSIRSGGVQIASDYATQPLVATFPTPTVHGSAAVPSLLDVYVNDVFAMRKDVASGPFDLQNLPLVSGAGTVTLVEKDVLGQEHIVNAPYYFTRDLLKPGLTSYSYSAGFERADLGPGGNGYGPFIAEATQRRGLSNSFTGGAHVEYAPSHAMAALTADVLSEKAGVFSFALANSADHGTLGALWSAAYDYRRSLFSAGGLYQQTTPGFRTLDLSNLTNASRELEVHGSMQIARRSAIGAALSSATTAGSTSTVMTGSYSSTVNRIPFSISAFRASGTNVSSTGVRANVYFATSGRGLVKSTVGAGGSTPGMQTTFSESAPESGVGLSYDVTAGTGGAGSGASVRYYGTSINADVTTGDGTSAIDASATGGIVFGRGHAAAVQSVSGGYGFASVPGYGGIPVYVNNVFVGKTDAKGNVAFSNLAPYAENQVRLDTSSLPATVQIENPERIVIPYDKNPVYVRFTVTGSGAACAQIALAGGSALPAGSTVTTLGGGQTWPVGSDGRVYLSPVGAGTLHLVANYGDGMCNATAAVPATPADAIANLGTIVCMPIPVSRADSPHTSE